MPKKNEGGGLTAVCERDALTDAISTVTKALGKMMPALEGILIESGADYLRLTCTDTNLGITTMTPAIVKEHGRVLLPGKSFAEYVKMSPKGGQIMLTEIGGTMHLSTVKNKTKMATIDAGDFPELPKADNPATVLLSGIALINLIEHTAFSAATDMTRPILSGIHFDVSDGLCRAAALDGYRLAYCSEQYTGEAEAVSCTVPAAACRHLAALTQPDSTVILEVGKSYIAAIIGGTRAVVRLLAGEFMAYHKIVPTEWNTRVKLSKEELGRALDRVSIMSVGQQSQLVTLHVADEGVTVHTASVNGESVEQLELASREGRNIDIAFNSRYLKDFVKNFTSGDCFYLYMTTPSNCGLLRPERDPESAYHLVLPVRQMDTVAG